MRPAAGDAGAPRAGAATPRDAAGPGRGMLTRVGAALSALAVARSYWMLALAAAVVIGPAMMPVYWYGNEIVYYDLAYRAVAPEAFTDAHAMVDGSNARIVAMVAMGSVIKALGFEGAKTVLSLAAWALYALALAAVGRALGLRVIELAAALLIFLLAGQELMGREWIFGTVEPKVPAYICVLFGLAAALNRRWTAAILLSAAGTYFHFLVGGAWAVLVLLLLVMDRPRPWHPLRLLALYAVLVLPILGILVSERLGAPVDTSSLDGTVDQLYAVFAAPFHVAPFAEGLRVFVLDWMPGAVLHGALAVALYWSASSAEGRHRTVILWAGVLNILPLLALAAAFVDRDTHHLAKFLIFRPSALILLMSCLLLARALIPQGRAPAAHGGTAVLLILALLLPDYLRSAGSMALRLPPGARLEAQLEPDERDVVRWISDNTERDAAVLLVPAATGISEESAHYPLGVERLTGRGTIVSYKNVPSDLREFVRWYGLLSARAAFSAGDCSRLNDLGADYVVFETAGGPPAFDACVRPLYRNETFVIARPRAPS
jgi:hypothetical protein